MIFVQQNAELIGKNVLNIRIYDCLRTNKKTKVILKIQFNSKQYVNEMQTAPLFSNILRTLFSSVQNIVCDGIGDKQNILVKEFDKKLVLVTGPPLKEPANHDMHGLEFQEGQTWTRKFTSLCSAQKESIDICQHRKKYPFPFFSIDI